MLLWHCFDALFINNTTEAMYLIVWLTLLGGAYNIFLIIQLSKLIKFFFKDG